MAPFVSSAPLQLQQKITRRGCAITTVLHRVDRRIGRTLLTQIRAIVLHRCTKDMSLSRHLSVTNLPILRGIANSAGTPGLSYRTIKALYCCTMHLNHYSFEQACARLFAGEDEDPEHSRRVASKTDRRSVSDVLAGGRAANTAKEETRLCQARHALSESLTVKKIGENCSGTWSVSQRQLFELRPLTFPARRTLRTFFLASPFPPFEASGSTSCTVLGTRCRAHWKGSL